MSILSFILLITLVLLVILSAFLSGSETAITATSKARIISKIKKTSIYDIPYYISDNRLVSNVYKWKPKNNIFNVVNDVYLWLKKNKSKLKKYF